MANSTTNLDTIAVNQAQKEVTANALFDAGSPATLYGRRAQTSGGLVWGYYGGTALVGGTPTQIANGTLTLAASATNYIEANASTGAVSSNTTGFTSGRTQLYTVVTDASTVTSYTDLRVSVIGTGGTVSSVNGHSGAVTLTASDVGAVGTAAVGAASGVASLDSGGKLPTSQLPNMAIIDYLGTVSSQAAMLALSGQKGDWCIRSDDSKVYVITGTDPTQASSWTSLSYPTGTNGTVTSVDLSVPGLLYTVSGNPVTGAGTLTFSLKTQAKNTFLAGPASGADATPTMRALTQADLPAQPFDLTAFYPGVPSSSAIVTRVPVARAVTFPAGLTGSVGKASVAATASAAFDVQKNGSSVGTITFGAGATSATFTAASVITLAAGDVLSIIAPASADATLANVGFVLAGTR